MTMLKKIAGKRATQGKEAEADEVRLHALLASPFVDKIVTENEQKILSARQRQADEVARIQADLLRKIPEFDARLAATRSELETAEKRVAELRDSFRKIDYEKSLFFNQAMHSKSLLENELRLSAPMIDDFITEMMDLWERNQHVSASEIVLSSKIDLAGLNRQVTIETDAPSANSWQIRIGQVITAARAMKLDPDFRTYPERLARLRDLVADPENFKRITVTKEIALQPSVLKDKGVAR